MKCIIFDVDGVFNTGQFIYTEKGKVAKLFGPHDADGIKMLKDKIKIIAISADEKGFSITKKRIEEDMGIILHFVPEKNRLQWLKEHFDLNECIYVGDGIHDSEIFEHAGYAIAPKSAFYLAKEKADYVTKANAGEGAVLDACLHVMSKFLKEDIPKIETIDRNISVITGKEDLEHLYTIKDFPALILCTHKAQAHDIRQDLSFYICKKTGIVQIKTLIPQEILYRNYHSEALGPLWKEHHDEFLKLLHEYQLTNVFEIGGSNGYMARAYTEQNKDASWVLIDISPNVQENDRIKVIKKLFEDADIPRNADIVHSHVFEHMLSPDKFIAKIHSNLQIGKFHIFSIPNLELYLKNKFPNMMNFEHTLFLNEYFVDYAMEKYSFEIIEKKYFKDHSIFYVTRKKADEIKTDYLPKNQYTENKQKFSEYFQFYQQFVRDYSMKLDSSGNCYLFGAHVFSQFLLAMGLEQNKIKCILDNSDVKEGKRLYGTNLLVQKPNVLRTVHAPKVIVRVGPYQKEVEEQLKSINKDVEIIY